MSLQGNRGGKSSRRCFEEERGARRTDTRGPQDHGYPQTCNGSKTHEARSQTLAPRTEKNHSHAYQLGRLREIQPKRGKRLRVKHGRVGRVVFTRANPASKNMVLDGREKKGEKVPESWIVPRKKEGGEWDVPNGIKKIRAIAITILIRSITV